MITARVVGLDPFPIPIAQMSSPYSYPESAAEQTKESVWADPLLAFLRPRLGRVPELEARLTRLEAGITGLETVITECQGEQEADKG